MEKHGIAWINNIQKPICEVRDIKNGKDKGKVEVTLCKGRNADGTIRRGKKKIIPYDQLVEFPEEVL